MYLARYYEGIFTLNHETYQFFKEQDLHDSCIPRFVESNSIFLYSALTTDSNLSQIFWLTDKKNENKEVAVDDFLGAESAVAAISHSM